jgi:hypothetical protein
MDLVSQIEVPIHVYATGENNDYDNDRLEGKL